MYFTFTHRSFDVGTFGTFDFIISCFLNPHVNLRCVMNTVSLFQKKMIMNPFFYHNSSMFFNVILIKVYYNMWTIERLTIFLLNMNLHFKFIYN
jgi:hypothetical protein